MKYPVFSNASELVNFADKFILKERLPSLKKDVEACLKEECAFPALLYCFANIDLLGALYKGYATNTSQTRGNFNEYVCRFMRNGGQHSYTRDQAELLQDIFRHKIVHLAQPKLIINRKPRKIGWVYVQPDTSDHLEIVRTGTLRNKLLAPYDMYYDHLFIISITRLVNDIVDSVIRTPDGYFPRLKTGYRKMQTNFSNAIEQIYNPDE
jgi:hypothetical protein